MYVVVAIVFAYYVCYLFVAENIENITNNVRLGLGAFNEKLVQPFFVEPLGTVCPQVTCSPENSFAVRHIVNFTDDNAAFSVSSKVFSCKLINMI